MRTPLLSLAALGLLSLAGCDSDGPGPGHFDGGTGSPGPTTDVGLPDLTTPPGASDGGSPPGDAGGDGGSGEPPRPPATCPDWHCTQDCEALIPFPGSHDPMSVQAKADGYYIFTDDKYTYLKRHIVQMVRYSACEVARRYPGVPPLGLSDMSQKDGKTPGTDVGSPRHPTTTHTGNDIDLAYYQTDGANNVQIICGDGSDTNGNGQMGKYNDGYFCTTKENIINWDQEVWFFAKMAETPRVRVFGIDQTLPDKFTAGADALLKKGEVSQEIHDRMTLLGYGKAGGWSFHHHHSHMSYKPTAYSRSTRSGMPSIIPDE